MVGAQEVAAQLAGALAAAARCAGEDTTQKYDALAQDLADLETVAKGACASHSGYRAVVGKLRAGTALSADDIATLRLLMVGDADYYVKYDEELDRCKAETTKIVAEMQRLQAGELTADALMHLSVLAHEARAMLELVRHYFESRDRIRRFEAATGGPIDPATARALIALIADSVA